MAEDAAVHATQGGREACSVSLDMIIGIGYIEIISEYIGTKAR